MITHTHAHTHAHTHTHTHGSCQSRISPNSMPLHRYNIISLLATEFDNLSYFKVRCTATCIPCMHARECTCTLILFRFTTCTGLSLGGRCDDTEHVGHGQHLCSHGHQHRSNPGLRRLHTQDETQASLTAYSCPLHDTSEVSLILSLYSLDRMIVLAY